MTPAEKGDRASLRNLARRRKRLDREKVRLAEETERAIVGSVSRGSTSVSEAARLSGVHRSTAYEYLKAAN